MTTLRCLSDETAPITPSAQVLSAPVKVETNNPCRTTWLERWGPAWHTPAIWTGQRLKQEKGQPELHGVKPSSPLPPQSNIRLISWLDFLHWGEFLSLGFVGAEAKFTWSPFISLSPLHSPPLCPNINVNIRSVLSGGVHLRDWQVPPPPHCTLSDVPTNVLRERLDSGISFSLYKNSINHFHSGTYCLGQLHSMFLGHSHSHLAQKTNYPLFFLRWELCFLVTIWGTLSLKIKKRKGHGGCTPAVPTPRRPRQEVQWYPQLPGKFEINSLDDERRTILEFSNDV